MRVIDPACAGDSHNRWLKFWGARHFASSASVYGPTPPVPTDEQAPVAPDNPYAQSKADGEAIVADFHGRGQMSAVSLRLFNVFGPRQDPGSGYAAAIPQFISRVLQNEDITIYGDGLQTRDFVFVKDVAAAFRHLSVLPHSPSPFNVGGSKAITVNELVHEIIELTNSTSKIIHQSPRRGDARFSEADHTKLTETRWTPQFNLKEGLSKTVAWHRSSLSEKRPF